MEFKLPIFVVLEASRVSFPVIRLKQQILIAGKHHYYTWACLFNKSICQDEGLPHQKLFLQLHPCSSQNHTTPKRSLLSVNWLKRNAVFHWTASHHDSCIISIKKQMLLLFGRSKQLSYPRRRLKNNLLHIIPTSANFEEKRHSLMQTIPKKRMRVELHSCCVCETEMQSFVDLDQSFSDPIDKDSLVLLCPDAGTVEDKESHYCCVNCLVENFKCTRKPIKCLVCSTNSTWIPLQAALAILCTDCTIAEGCLSSVKELLEAAPDAQDEQDCEFIKDFIDEHIEANSLLDVLCNQYILHYENTRQPCACHRVAATGRIDEASNYVFFDDTRVYPLVCVSPNGSRRVEYHAHPPICHGCLDVHPPEIPCEITELYLNPYYRNTTDASCKSKLYRNYELTEPRINQYLVHLVTNNWLYSICPGCHAVLHRTEQCHELSCQCGYRMCALCGYAVFQQFAILDHFSCDESLLSTGMYCPRYPQNVNLPGVTRQCTTACQSHTAGDCTIPAHKAWRDALLKYRRDAHIRKFLASLPHEKQMKATMFLLTSLQYEFTQTSHAI